MIPIIPVAFKRLHKDAIPCLLIPSLTWPHHRHHYTDCWSSESMCDLTSILSMRSEMCSRKCPMTTTGPSDGTFRACWIYGWHICLKRIDSSEHRNRHLTGLQGLYSVEWLMVYQSIHEYYRWLDRKENGVLKLEFINIFIIPSSSSLYLSSYARDLAWVLVVELNPVIGSWTWRRLIHRAGNTGFLVPCSVNSNDVAQSRRV